MSSSLDGTQVLVLETTNPSNYDLVVMSEAGDSAVFADYLRANWHEAMATVSPDGERVAYVSDQNRHL